MNDPMCIFAKELFMGVATVVVQRFPSQEVSCFIETLSRFRPDLTLLAELQAIEGEDDFLPMGEAPLMAGA
jgi:hypothetical protein